MSFTGDLEHLPIVDVIQLLHSTGKSGTLTVEGNQRQSQLVFSQGYIVSANHSDLSVRIGQILVDMKAISVEDRDRALREQREAEGVRKPLIAILIEKNMIDRETAYRGLEILIEMTIVEILTWPSGTFTLDLNTNIISDEYRYFPEKCHQEINLNTQNILMDALRIYDEKVRDGEPLDKLFPETDMGAANQAPSPPTADKADTGGTPAISAADLGLDAIDDLSPKIPDVFSSLKDRDEGEEHRQVIRQHLPSLPAAECEKLVDFLKGYVQQAGRGEEGSSPDIRRQAVVLFSRDPMIRHTATTACRHAGLMSFSSEVAADLEPIIEQSLAKQIVPTLVLDGPEGADGDFSPGRLVALRQKIRQRYPRVPIVQMAAYDRYLFLLQAIVDGVTSILPRPATSQPSASFVEETICFLQAFARCAACSGEPPAPEGPLPLEEQLSGLQELGQGAADASEISSAILRIVRNLFRRAMTLVVGHGELRVERVLGLETDAEGTGTVLGSRLPLGAGSLLSRVVTSGTLFLGNAEDPVLREHLYSRMAPPRHKYLLLLPIKARGRTVALVYGDFGDGEVSGVPTNLLKILATQAGLSLENALLRKQIEKSGPRSNR